MPMKINPDECTACGDCADACPNSAIESKSAYFVIDKSKCDECGSGALQACADVCPSNCIDYL